MSLLAFGEALVDFLSDGKNPESFTKFPGGAPANVAVAYAKLGGDSYFCGALGNDMFGDFLLDAIKTEGVDTQYCVRTSQAKTGLAFVSLDDKGERSFSFYRPPAADLLFKASDFSPQAFTCASIFHICSNSLTQDTIYQTTLAGLVKANDANCVCSFDINLRENLWQNIAKANERIWQCIAATDVLKFSPEELQFLVGQNQHLSTLEQVVEKCFSLGVSLVVYTRGNLPVRYFTKHFQGTAPIPAIDVVDTTAAGDAFVGAMLFQLSQRLKHGHELNELVSNEQTTSEVFSFATACGALACTKAGAFPSLPALGDVSNFQRSEE